MPRKQTLNQTLNSASTAARNWLIAKNNARTGNALTNGQAGKTNSPSTNHGFDSGQGNSIDGDGTSETRPRLLSSASKSQTEPMGRGQPLPPPGTPLPPPKTEKRQTWAIPAAAAASTFANLAKRKPAPTPHGKLGASSQEHLDLPSPATPLPLQSPLPYGDFSNSLHVAGDAEEIFRKNSVTSDTAADGRRRKSSAASSTHSNQAPPPLPKRRQRQPSLNMHPQQRRASQAHIHDDVPEGLLVVEAPVAEGSAPPSPVPASTFDEILKVADSGR